MVPEQAGIFSLGRINWLGFNTEKESAVQYEVNI